MNPIKRLFKALGVVVQRINVYNVIGVLLYLQPGVVYGNLTDGHYNEKQGVIGIGFLGYLVLFTLPSWWSVRRPKVFEIGKCSLSLFDGKGFSHYNRNALTTGGPVLWIWTYFWQRFEKFSSEPYPLAKVTQPHIRALASSIIAKDKDNNLFELELEVNKSLSTWFKSRWLSVLAPKMVRYTVDLTYDKHAKNDSKWLGSSISVYFSESDPENITPHIREILQRYGLTLVEYMR
jgi:hypothetical protein